MAAAVPTTASTIEELRTELWTVKREVDALQIAAAETRRPWYSNASVILSLLALLFSFGTTAVSYVRTQQQDVQAARAELRGLIQRLNELPVRNMELAREYAAEPNLQAMAGSFLAHEQSLLAKQATAVIDRIPGHVTATEYFGVAFALSAAGAYPASLRLLDDGLKVADNFGDEVSIRRQYGMILFQLGKPVQGREQYLEATRIFDKYAAPSSAYRDWTEVLTRMYWAQTEAMFMYCAEAAQQLSEASKSLQKLPPTPNFISIRAQVAQTGVQIDQCRAAAAGQAVPAPALIRPSPPVP